MHDSKAWYAQCRLLHLSFNVLNCLWISFIDIGLVWFTYRRNFITIPYVVYNCCINFIFQHNNENAEKMIYFIMRGCEIKNNCSSMLAGTVTFVSNRYKEAPRPGDCLLSLGTRPFVLTYTQNIAYYRADASHAVSLDFSYSDALISVIVLNCHDIMRHSGSHDEWCRLVIEKMLEMFNC